MSKYTTGEMAKLCNVSVRTVQFYDTKGILAPTELSEGGRRLYNDDDLQKFQLILTLKAIGLSLSAIKNVLESELSGEILTILLDEQVKLLAGEIGERQKQLEIVNAIKKRISDKAIVPVNSIIGIEDTMVKNNNVQSRKTLAMIYIGVGIASAIGLAFMVWLVALRIWWGLAAFIATTIICLLFTAFLLKDKVFICPKCNSVFKLSLGQTFFSTGNHKVRWMTCPDCGNQDWCVMKNQKQQ